MELGGEAEREGAKARADGAELLPRLIHDLRNPLGVMLSFAEIIPTADDAERAEFCARLAANAQRALHVLDDYALLSDARAGRVELRIAQCAWLPLVRAAVEDARADAGGPRRLQCRGETAALVRADGERVHYALRCLLRDLLRSVGSGGSVSVEARADGGGAIADVSVDFDPGVRFVGSVLDEDSLGTELARAVAGLHGGTLEVGTAARPLVARLRLAVESRGANSEG